MLRVIQKRPDTAGVEVRSALASHSHRTEVQIHCCCAGPDVCLLVFKYHPTIEVLDVPDAVAKLAPAPAAPSSAVDLLLLCDSTTIKEIKDAKQH